jgi:hypothetical protein
MGNRKTAGLTKRGGIWHIDKQIGGTRVRESTGTGDFGKALELLAKRIDQLREARLYGLRPERTFRAAATKYLTENLHKRSIHNDVLHLKHLDPFIGSLMLRQVHVGTLQAFIAQRRADGVKTKTINGALETVRRIVNLAASEWMDERGMTWLESWRARGEKLQTLCSIRWSTGTAFSKRMAHRFTGSHNTPKA